MNEIYDNERLQERQSTPLALSSSGTANPAVSSDTKPDCHERSGNTGDSARPYVGKHTVFVLNVKGKPLTPTTAAKARKLIKGGKAEKVWSKFNTFGIQLVEEVRNEVPQTTLGYDSGTKFEGISVVCGRENNLSVKLDLPDKKKIVRKMEERKALRHNRRYRNCRRRRARFNNRGKKGFIAPSQLVVVNSRLKILNEFCRIYPIQKAAIEDVRFNHAKHRWGANFSTVEIGKKRIRAFFKDRGIDVVEYRGFETASIRKKYGYKKTSVKNADKFTAHCSDSLALANEVGFAKRVSEGPFLIVDDTYRCVRRKLHDTQPAVGGSRERYSQGNVNGIRKGTVVCSNRGKEGQLCGVDRGSFKYLDKNQKRQTTKELRWLNNHFRVK